MFDITVICADGTSNKNYSKKLLEDISNKCKVEESKFFTPSSIQEYNKFIVLDLNRYVQTEFCMIIQLDGFPINLEAWNDKFLSYDYIGAPWYMQPWPLDKTVGNGGFSIRSKKFLEETSKLDYDGIIPEDVFLCRNVDSLLKSKKVRFAPHDLAYTFSVEDMPYKGQYGFHGKQTIAISKHFGIFQ